MNRYFVHIFSEHIFCMYNLSFRNFSLIIVNLYALLLCPKLKMDYLYLFQLISNQSTICPTPISIYFICVIINTKTFIQHSCCLAGRAYPLGDIPEDMEADVKKNVFQCITRMKIKAGQSAVFPYLLYLVPSLKFFRLRCIKNVYHILSLSTE